MKNKRKDDRIGVSFPIECNKLTSKSYFYTVSKDLSESGVKILTDNFIPRGDCLKLNINLIDRIVELKAKVAWCNPEKTATRFAVGLQFIEINDQNRNAINHFLSKVYN